MTNTKHDNGARSYWRGFSQRELDLILDAVRDNFIFQIYLGNMGLDIRKFGDANHKEEYFEQTIRRIVAEELQKALKGKG